MGLIKTQPMCCWILCFLTMATTSIQCNSKTINQVKAFYELTNNTRTTNLLGYGPMIEYIAANNNTPSNSVTIYLHGWNRDKSSCKNSILYATPAILFNFPDATPNKSEPWTTMSIAQLPDIMPVLVILGAIATSDIAQTINFVGHSRGGGVIINLLAILNHPEKYEDALQQIGLDNTMRTNIITMIERGVIVLDCPLKNVYAGIRQKVYIKRSRILRPMHTDTQHSLLRNYVAAIYNRLTHYLDHTCTFLLQYVIFPLSSRYKPWGEHPSTSVKQLDGLKLTTIIRYDDGDHIITNDGDDEFFMTLQANNPDSTYLITSKNCGHCSPCTPLAELFFKLTQKQAHSW